MTSHFLTVMAAVENALPQFPQLPHGPQWSGNVQQAYQLLANLHARITTILRQEENDPIRLNILRQQIFSSAMPILESYLQEGVPIEWIVMTIHLFGQLAITLRDVAEASDGM